METETKPYEVNYFHEGLEWGCGREQMELLVKAGIMLQSRQLAASAAARACDEANGPNAIGYGGARAGGKSHWLLAQIGADDCQRVRGLKCLLLRKVGKANLENFEDFRRRLFRLLPHEFNSSRAVLTFANESRIVAGHFQNEKDIDAYLGLEYDVIGIEEATTLSYRKQLDISTCCRSSKPGWRPRIYSTTNPGGVGHAWYKEKFIDPFYRGEEKETRFISARVSDNKMTNDGYETQVLGKLTGWQKRAWLEGEWDIAAGQFFTTFHRDMHVIQSFDRTKATEWWCAMDYGFKHYTVVLLGCRDGDGNIYVIDEYAQRKTLAPVHAANIQELLRRHGLDTRSLRGFFAGADIFSTESDGSTVASRYGSLGIALKPANSSRRAGWAELLERFGDPGTGVAPSLFIHERCHRVIETLPLLQHDAGASEDVHKVDCDDDGHGGDDAADCLRYLVHTRALKSASGKLRGL